MGFFRGPAHKLETSECGARLFGGRHVENHERRRKKSEPKKNSSDLLGMITGRIGKITALIVALTVLLGAAEKFF